MFLQLMSLITILSVYWCFCLLQAMEIVKTLPISVETFKVVLTYLSECRRMPGIPDLIASISSLVICILLNIVRTELFPFMMR